MPTTILESVMDEVNDMTIFEMVKYHTQEYPTDIPLRIEECAAHMDVTAIKAALMRSMHTEYSYGKRKFDSPIIGSYPALTEANKDGVPQLWKSIKWGQQFADFVITLAGDAVPAVIEIHPPFTDYTDMSGFVSAYKVFEERILGKYPNVDILIENRCGSVYKGGKFLVSKLQDVATLCEQIEQQKLRLRIAYDVPQIYTAHNAKKQDAYLDLIRQTKDLRPYIGGVHLWGKRKAESGRLVSHCGDLNSYFDGDTETKGLFLQEFASCFNDGFTRKMVLEVNSGNDDLNSIITDLRSVGVMFE